MSSIFHLGPPTPAIDSVVMTITSRSAVIIWTIPSVAYTFEQYRVNYGQSQDSLTMTSEILDSTDLNAVNVTYNVTLNGLYPYSTYYIQVESTNSESSSFTSVQNFTTSEEGIYSYLTSSYFLIYFLL